MVPLNSLSWSLNLRLISRSFPHPLVCLLTRKQFVVMLSNLSRGTLMDKMRWIFSLYDIESDGYITKDEMVAVVQSIYDLMGDRTYPSIQHASASAHVDKLFSVRRADTSSHLALKLFPLLPVRCSLTRNENCLLKLLSRPTSLQMEIIPSFQLSFPTSNWFGDINTKGKERESASVVHFIRSNLHLTNNFLSSLDSLPTSTLFSFPLSSPFPNWS